MRGDFCIISVPPLQKRPAYRAKSGFAGLDLRGGSSPIAHITDLLAAPYDAFGWLDVLPYQPQRPALSPFCRVT